MKGRALPIKSSSFYRKGRPDYMKISIFHMKIRSLPRKGRTLHMKRRANYRKSPGALRSGRARSVVRSPLPLKRRPHQRSERLGSTGPPLLTRNCRLTTYAHSAISASARRFPGFRARDRRSGCAWKEVSLRKEIDHDPESPTDRPPAPGGPRRGSDGPAGVRPTRHLFSDDFGPKPLGGWT